MSKNLTVSLCPYYRISQDINLDQLYWQKPYNTTRSRWMNNKDICHTSTPMVKSIATAFSFSHCLKGGMQQTHLNNVPNNEKVCLSET